MVTKFSIYIPLRIKPSIHNRNKILQFIGIAMCWNTSLRPSNVTIEIRKGFEHHSVIPRLSLSYSVSDYC